MTFTEFRLLLGNDWGLMVLAGILLYMFILRLRRVRGFLGTTGTIATSVLLLMLVWMQWNKYSVGQQILDIAAQKGAGYQLMAEDRTPIRMPAVLEVNRVRYVIDVSATQQKRYLPWTVIALPN